MRGIVWIIEYMERGKWYPCTEQCYDSKRIALRELILTLQCTPDARLRVMPYTRKEADDDGE